MSSWIISNVWTILLVSVLLPAALCFVHLLVWGPVRLAGDTPVQNIRRFNKWERIMHWVRLISFFAAIITGAILAAKLSDARIIKEIHEPMVKLFLLASIIAVIFWFKDMLPRGHDREWLAHNGGYFSRSHESYPAGRFNAGQKISFWLSLILVLAAYISGDNLREGGTVMLAVHIATSLILMAVVMVHAYLGTVANPGTAGVIIHGKVSQAWARHHHPRWDYKLVDES